ncbi:MULTISPECIES: LysR substrate-binding domain-containing protein [unclassified Rhizobium]|uniref:LysR substrate-binding domain-containing protein n=1 Tax=unclassified Rhizobium TaxID=2613769 RepID=UPI000CDF384A|nr:MULTISPECIES: LysR substrate-binding domain-containing protein [Rhizobium]AVA23253.1 LysR family transcriptional regulator protein [Rhizobium sp. NXC24]UWU20607.1 LysR substrate-binding domain-containing protein [Rhizobium tropici]
MLEKIPLESFRVFDAAARAMNFSRAGRELNITQAAVSRRIKGLEDHLGAALFTRRGRNLALTPEGERLFQRVRATLEYLEESLEPFRAGTGEIISIAASGSVSHLWLGQRLKDFGKESPGISVRLLTTDSPSELASETNDLVILYSTGEHPRWNLTLLMKEVLVPIASPDYLASRGLEPQALTSADIAGLDLIDYERFNAHWISFRQWFGRIGNPLRSKLPRPRLSFSTYIMAVEAALRGEGIALGSLGLIEEHLRSGALITIGNDRVESGFGYYLGAPRFRALSPEAGQLHRHLLGGYQG